MAGGVLTNFRLKDAFCEQLAGQRPRPHPAETASITNGRKQTQQLTVRGQTCKAVKPSQNGHCATLINRLSGDLSKGNKYYLPPKSCERKKRTEREEKKKKKNSGKRQTGRQRQTGRDRQIMMPLQMGPGVGTLGTDLSGKEQLTVKCSTCDLQE